MSRRVSRAFLDKVRARDNRLHLVLRGVELAYGEPVESPNPFKRPPPQQKPLIERDNLWPAPLPFYKKQEQLLKEAERLAREQAVRQEHEKAEALRLRQAVFGAAARPDLHIPDLRKPARWRAVKVDTKKARERFTFCLFAHERLTPQMFKEAMRPLLNLIPKEDRDRFEPKKFKPHKYTLGEEGRDYDHRRIGFLAVLKVDQRHLPKLSPRIVSELYANGVFTEPEVPKGFDPDSLIQRYSEPANSAA